MRTGLSAQAENPIKKDWVAAFRKDERMGALRVALACLLSNGRAPGGLIPCGRAAVLDRLRLGRGRLIRPAKLLGEPFGEQHQGLAIDLGVIPLAHRDKIGGALAERLAGAPAAGLE